ncbi:MAG TPA: ATP phosphoribosyltransferase regulatory subunit, partial [Burkholderiaceae bacterium]|nr:ATP phosphoribosyltransferase regulatory subunit [Burkholderiaceae bacterium]
LARLWKVLGLERVRLELNCLGQAEERARHRTDLIAYFERHVDKLDADAKRRLHTNPLRILDSKNSEVARVAADAPRITDYLGQAARTHFEALQALLHETGVEFTVNPRLVRGLDYYNLTVYEWITESLGSQGTICGGGRYDPLVERLGGKSTPACGFAIGNERVIELLREVGTIDLMPVTDVYVLHQSGTTATSAFVLAERMRDAGLDVILHAGDASMKSQMKRADTSGAAFAVIVGESEAAQGAAAVKALRATAEDAPFAQQSTVPLTQVPEALLNALLYETSRIPE